MQRSISGLAAYLVNENLLAEEKATHALDQAKQQGLSFITYLITQDILTSSEILKSCAQRFGLTIFDLKNYDLTWLNHPNFNYELMLRYRILPLDEQQGLLRIGLSDPTDQAAIDAIIFHTGYRVAPLLIAEDQLNQFIQSHLTKPNGYEHLELELLHELSQEEVQQTIQEKSQDEEPLIKFVDGLIQNALHKSASDIHIEPYETSCRIRYRQDGILYPIANIPLHLANRVVTRLKVMAKLDIGERRLPQDGRVQLNNTDIRINTCPTLFGEKVVLRILNASKVTLEIDALGFSDFQKKIFLEKIRQSQGMIIVTGPTGSGKTLTLYSALNYLNQSDKNISTVEDPIEIQLHGINQVNIHPKIGLNFPTVLRTFLRQDPDIIMVGEIRDHETAEIAIQAAQTGHLVLTTLHTNHALDTLVRLQSMGIATYQMISSISLIIAQRLVRKLCVHCKEIEIIPQQKNFSAYRAKGCQHCLDGYQGRTGIYEFLPMTESLSQLILAGSSMNEIQNQAKQEGFLTLKQMGMEKVMRGITSLAEIHRVIG